MNRQLHTYIYRLAIGYRRGLHQHARSTIGPHLRELSVTRRPVEYLINVSPMNVSRRDRYFRLLVTLA